MRRIPLLLLFPLTAFAQAASGPAPAPAEPERFTWSGKIAPGGTVVVRNDHGDIRARYGGREGKVEVMAVIQHLSARQPPLAVRAREGAGGVTVSVDYGDADAPANEPVPDRADLVVFVPEGATLEARTEAGLIEVKGLQGPVSARSVRGDLSFSVAGPVTAFTEQGRIRASLDPAVTAPQRLETRTGDIFVTLRDNANLALEASTSGEIATDFTLRMERMPHAEPDKKAFVKIGRGRAKLTVLSKRGRIRLTWLPASEGEMEIDSD